MPPDEARNPFTMLSARPVYENRWISVVEHQVLTPRGTPGIYGVVQFKNRAVGVIPYRDGKIWLVGQYRVPLGQYSWEIPEGGVPRGEDLIEGARRELREETGLEARLIEPLVEMHLSNSVSDEWGIVYLAREISDAGPAQPEETEELALRTLPLEEAYQMVCAGRITDSLSVAGILRLVLLVREGRVG
jgi:8-oxo-dGTP pyrophosphatase MutT (NUDIX family)